MTRRTLGKTTLTASRIGLGCATFGREIGQAESFTVLDHAIASGINVLDTAEAYGGGQSRQARRNLTGVDDPLEATDELHSSELILGRWLAARGGRERVIVQTKVLPPLSKQRVLASIDASLARLRTDFIDLFLFHAPDPHTPMQESLEAIQSAMRAGKIRCFGASNFSAQRVCEMNRAAEALDLPPIQVLQSNYNLAVRDIEEELLPLCEAQGMGVQTYSPLGAGFLTGKYGNRSNEVPRGSRFDIVPGHQGVYFDEEKFALLQRLQSLAARLGTSPARIALAWVLNNPQVDCVLVGARTCGHIDQAVESLNVQFDPEWHAALEATPRKETTRV